MMDVDEYDMQRILMMLDASQETLDAAARAEASRESGKRLRKVTAQQRAATVRTLVAEMCEKYEIAID